MCTQRRSISAVWGYSSLSIMFLSIARSIRRWTCGSSHVWQNVARFWRELPSSMSSSATTWNVVLGLLLVGGEPVLRGCDRRSPIGVDELVERRN